MTLSGPDPGPLSRTATRLMLSQLAWTLRQDPTVKTFSLEHRRTPGDRRVGRVDVPGRQPRRRPLRPGRPAGQQPALRAPPRSARLGSGQPPHSGRRAVRARACRGSARSRSASTTTRSPPRPPTRCWSGRSGAVRTRPRSSPGAGCCLLPGTSPNRLWDVQNTGRRAPVVLYVAQGARAPGARARDQRSRTSGGSSSRVTARAWWRSCAAATATASSSAGCATTRTAAVVSGTRARPYPVGRRHAPASATSAGCRRPRSPCSTRRLATQAEVRLLDVDGSMSPDETPPSSSRVGPSAWPPRRPRPRLTTPFAVQPGELFDLAQVDTTGPAAGHRACATSPTRADPQAGAGRRRRPAAACGRLERCSTPSAT